MTATKITIKPADLNIRYYPAWVSDEGWNTLYIDSEGSFTANINNAVHFGNMRMAALFANGRRPDNKSFFAPRTFTIFEAHTTIEFVDVLDSARASGFVTEKA